MGRSTRREKKAKAKQKGRRDGGCKEIECTDQEPEPASESKASVHKTENTVVHKEVESEPKHADKIVSETNDEKAEQHEELVGDGQGEVLEAAMHEQNLEQQSHLDTEKPALKPGHDNLEHVQPPQDGAFLDDASSESMHCEGAAADDASSTISDCEPTFHEEHIHSSVSDILTRDSVSAMAVCAKHIALGMQTGMIYVVSRAGDLERGFRFHTAPVMDVVFDSSGDFVASAGMDGIVAIASLTTSEQYEFDFRRPMRTVRLEPHFASRTSRAFVCGGMSGVLVYKEKRWLGFRDVVLHSDEGPIWALAWRGRWIAWANDRGVRVADAATHDIISLIPSPDDAPRPELARCTLTWRDASTLVIAHGERITIAHVRERSASAYDEMRASIPTLPTWAGLVQANATQAPAPYVEITDIFQLESVVAGVACTPEYMAALVCTEAESSLEAELRCVSEQGRELGSDMLDLKLGRCNDVHLCMTMERVFDAVRQDYTRRPVFYVAGPSCVSVLRARDERDHILWLLERRAYRAALESLEALGSGPCAALGFDVATIGREYLMYLIDECGDYDGAAALMPLLLRADADAWDSFVCMYLERQVLTSILPYIPTHDPQLSEVVYDLVLVHLLQRDPAQLRATLATWPSDIYSTRAVAAAIRDRAKNSHILLECLAQLYMADRQPGKALPYFLQLRDPRVFDLIREHDLLIDVQHKIGTLVELDQNCAGTSEPKHSALTPLLVEYTHSVPIHRAVAQLTPYPWYLYLYLHALFERDPALVAGYAMDLLRLYCRFDYPHLMPFLRTMASVYPLNEAYAVCEEHNYVPEMVLLRGRSGDLRGALRLIVERMHNAEMAIDFVRQQDDAELWDALLTYSKDRPTYIRGLLEHASGEIDPLRLLRPIRDGLVIPGLRPALIKILHNFHLQHALLRGGLAVLVRDASERAWLHTSARQSALACDAHTTCTVCHSPLLAPHTPIILFLCLHAAHAKCVGIDSAQEPSFAPVEGTTTQAYNHKRAAWMEQTPKTQAQYDTLRPTSQHVRLERANERASRQAQHLRHERVAHVGCPTCTVAAAHCLK